MLFLFLAGTMAAAGVVAPPADTTEATPHSGGFAQSTAGYGHGVAKQRGKWGITHFKDGKPVEESGRSAQGDDPSVAGGEPQPTPAPSPSKGVQSLGVPLPEAPVLPVIDGLMLEVAPPVKLRAIRVRGESFAPVPTLTASVMVGDGDDDAIRVAELLFGLTLATPTPGVPYYDEP